MGEEGNIARRTDYIGTQSTGKATRTAKRSVGRQHKPRIARNHWIQAALKNRAGWKSLLQVIHHQWTSTETQEYEGTKKIYFTPNFELRGKHEITNL